MGKTGVYCIKNMVNGKKYIGSSINIEERWASHKRALKNGTHHSPHLQYAWDKYGKENFDFYIIEECSDLERVDREQFYIDLYESYNHDKGYNISKSAATCVIPEEDRNYGEKCHTNIYPESMAKQAIELLQLGKYTYSQVATLSGLPEATIYAIVYHKNWRQLGKDVLFPSPNKEERKNVKLNRSNVEEIIQSFLKGETNKEISEKYGVDQKTISDIRNHKTWTELTKDCVFPRSPRYSKPTKLQQKILDVISQNPKLSSRTLAEIVGCSTGAIDGTLRKFKNNIGLRGEICQSL